MQLIAQILGGKGYSSQQNEVATLNTRVAVSIDGGKMAVTFTFTSIGQFSKWAGFSLSEGDGGRSCLVFYDSCDIVGVVDDLSFEDVIRYAGLELTAAKTLADFEGRKSSRWSPAVALTDLVSV